MEQFKPGKLTILVGPSGAGKSTFIRSTLQILSNDAHLVSSDGIRAELCGDFKDQTKNMQVFAAVHSIVKARITHGLDTVVDATNIRKSDRTAIVKLVPPNTEIEYVVLNRSMSEKMRDGGWRLSVPGLLEKHEQTFQDNLEDILNGDGFPNVKVLDRRIYV